MKNPTLLVTDLDAFLYEMGREDAMDEGISECEEQARLQYWKACGERDVIQYTRGRLSILDNEQEV